MPKERTESSSPYALFAIIVSVLGGLLMGYHLGIISGALLFLTPVFQLSTDDQGVVVSILLIGAMIGAFGAGPLADRMGRKKAQGFIALLFFLGALVMARADSYLAVLIGRCICGVGVGAVSVLSPLYVAEIAPAHLRGRFVSLYQLCVTLGILGAFLTSYVFATQQEWRGMFALGALPPLIQFLLIFFIPETPAWLLKQGKQKWAADLFDKLRVGRYAPLKAEKQVAKPAHWKTIFSSKYRFVCLIGFVLSTIQQITGINTVIYYAPTIFQGAGFASASSAILATVGIGVMNVLATILAVLLLDRAGRRPLLLWGLGGMILSLAALSFAFFSQSLMIDRIAVISLVTYVAFFAIGLGPVTFVLISEIYPLAIRARAMTIAMFLNWLFNYIVSLTFLDLIIWLGQGGTFLLFTLISAASLVFVWRWIPETKNKTLDQLEKELKG